MDPNWLSELWRSAMAFAGQSMESWQVDTGWTAVAVAAMLATSFLLSLPNRYSLMCRSSLVNFAEKTSDKLVSMIFEFIGTVFIGFLFLVSLLAICGILGGLLIFGMKNLLVILHEREVLAASAAAQLTPKRPSHRPSDQTAPQA